MNSTRSFVWNFNYVLIWALASLGELSGLPQYKIYQNLYPWSIGNSFCTVETLLVPYFASFRSRPRPVLGLVPPPNSFDKGVLTPTSCTFLALSSSSDGVRQSFLAKNKAERYTYKISTFPDTFMKIWDAEFSIKKKHYTFCGDKRI